MNNLRAYFSYLQALNTAFFNKVKKLINNSNGKILSLATEIVLAQLTALGRALF